MPELFSDDLFALLGDARPDYRWLIIGPHRSGSRWVRGCQGCWLAAWLPGCLAAWLLHGTHAASAGAVSAVPAVPAVPIPPLGSPLSRFFPPFLRSWHKDPNSTSAWNGVVRGSKKWVLYPPHITPPGGLVGMGRRPALPGIVAAAF